ncbi:MAG: cytochrome P450 [Verrucomicrobiota bacterium JB022]|nr:cytochrome P450 [Verrucomicrobiota bacterium JB022]
MSQPAGPSLTSEEAIHAYFSTPFDLLDRCALLYPDCFTLRLGTFGTEHLGANGDWVFVYEPTLLGELYRANTDAIRAGEANRVLFGEVLRPHCILALDGEAHQQRRRIVMAGLGKSQVASATQHVRGFAQQRLARLPHGEPISLLPVMQEIALEANLAALFGSPNEALRQRYSGAIETQQATATAESSNRMLAHLSALLREEIARRRRMPIRLDEQASLCEHLMHATDPSGTPLSDDDLLDELLLILIAGFHTTAVSLAWAVAWILSHPEVHARLRLELAAAGSEAETLPYLAAVVQESLRLSPIMVTAGVRLVKEDFDLGPYTLAAGTMVANCPYLLHRREDLFPQARTFLPDRFLGGSSKASGFTPFGGGNRKCVGTLFAIREMETVLATLFRQVNMELASPALAPILEGVFYAPQGGPQVYLSSFQA